MRARGLAPGARLRLANSQTMCLEDVWLVGAHAPDLLSEDLEGSLYDLLAQRYRIVVDRAEQETRPTVLDAEQAALLGVPPYSAALQV
ncbi:UTRA domain-containing protein [Kribbella shirazensis]|uniref:DNA-binding GntR family transcriptional regulator n=1 Tax=Kribbella shirazensis TaxID=1105143 RepID=A0A7X5V458_9ACTN|nr:UTRA domain-containing protein [Kribbella shirazensis]NIK54295.1 DNA-binding GntR family transcriptional regulator [Kribbella shirazensis]